ncbi:MAG: hypothetical protein EOP11_04960 [Proteobacteria bacterium]|nr:MAG: hypothetical protein EOP11_04960 [Pseudomonadota bacterium]
MRAIPCLIALLLPSFGVAAVTIRPGQSITVEPDTRPTIVSCAPLNQAAPSTGALSPARSTAVVSSDSSGAFCYCRQRLVGSSADYSLTKVTLAEGGARAETTLKSYASSNACDQAIATYAACK